MFSLEHWTYRSSLWKSYWDFLQLLKNYYFHISLQAKNFVQTDYSGILPACLTLKFCFRRSTIYFGWPSKMTNSTKVQMLRKLFFKKLNNIYTKVSNILAVQPRKLAQYERWQDRHNLSKKGQHLFTIEYFNNSSLTAQVTMLLQV